VTFNRNGYVNIYWDDKKKCVSFISLNLESMTQLAFIVSFYMKYCAMSNGATLANAFQLVL
jgi:hypothetical protein